MKTTLKILLVATITIFFAACNSTTAKQQTASIPEKTITVQKDIKVFYEGKLKYTVKKGESLVIVKSQPCRSDESATCLKVKHSKFGLGFFQEKSLTE